MTTMQSAITPPEEVPTVKLIFITPDAEQTIAQAARICYGKEESSDTPTGLVKRLRRDGHLATLRFAHATFSISNISRACSMQILRHKHLDFLQRSQRYVKEDTPGYVTPPSLEHNDDYHHVMRALWATYQSLLSRGIKPEDARFVLPNSCYTKMNVTGNFQAWYDFLYGNAGRLQKAAQWEIKQVAKEIQKQLICYAPNVFGKGD